MYFLTRKRLQRRLLYAFEIGFQCGQVAAAIKEQADKGKSQGTNMELPADFVDQQRRGFPNQ